MIIHEVTEECFKKYGKVIDSIDLTELVSTMQTVEIPADVVYEPSISALEKLKCATELQQKTYGELMIVAYAPAYLYRKLPVCFLL